MAREMRVNADRRAALMNMGTRTGLPSLKRLGVTLVQTLQYGTPLSQALRTLSAEMRQAGVDPVRGARRSAARTPDRADDRLHPALRVPDRGRPRDRPRHPAHAPIGSITMKRLVMATSLVVLAGCGVQDRSKKRDRFGRPACGRRRNGRRASTGPSPK